jgi:thiamine-phosphate pyrophosphorylase
MLRRIPPVYPITDKRLSGRATHLAILKELIRGGATWVQIRDKDTPVRELLADLQRCVEFSARHAVQLLVNDRCDLVMTCGAAGVHLGQDDLPPAGARRVLGSGRIIGYSTHTLRQVRASEPLPVDYIGFGPIYTTSTKAAADPVVGLARLRRVCREASRPVVAIGGIGLDQVREVLEAGAASAAVISALMRAQDLARRMEEFLKIATERR